jgi:hypothetical protein
LYSTPLAISGWRGVPLLALTAAIVVALPEARALLLVGLMGGVVVGLGLILLRHHLGSSGPRRGTPITLFPRPVDLASSRA